MPTLPTRPVYTLDLTAAGGFAEPDADPPETENKGKADEGKADPPPEKKAGNGGGSDVATRITTLVDERNAARTESEQRAAEVAKLRKQVEELKQLDTSAVVADLQKRLAETETATKNRFDKLLEMELKDLPDAARNAVLAIPGGTEAKYDWLVANRALLGGGVAEPPVAEKKRPGGAENEKKPPAGEGTTVSAAAQSYVAARKPKAGFPGLTG